MDKEKLIKILIEKYNESDKDYFTLNEKIIKTFDPTINNTIKMLNILEGDGYLNIKTFDKNKSTLVGKWEIYLTTKCLEYFSNKKELKRQNRNYWIQFWIPVSISSVALVVSIIALILKLK